LTDLDRRSHRVALVADRYVNPRPGGLDAIAVLSECGWGVIQLPADHYSAATAALFLEQVAEHAQEFQRRGYDLVLVGQRAGLRRALSAVGVRIPDRIDPHGPDELRAFLRDRPPPSAMTTG
jgi:hypothetical protein